MVETMGSIPGLGRSTGEWNGGLLQYTCLQNFMDRGAWRATVHGVTENWTHWMTNISPWSITWMANWKTHFKFQVLEFLRVLEQAESPWPIVCPVPWRTSHTYVWTPRLLCLHVQKSHFYPPCHVEDFSTPTGGPFGGLDQERDSSRSWKQVNHLSGGSGVSRACTELGQECWVGSSLGSRTHT